MLGCSNNRSLLFLFPGFPYLQFLIACSMQKHAEHAASDQKLEVGKAWEWARSLQQNY